MRRQKAYRELPTDALWWRTLEPALAAGLEIRMAGLFDGAPQLVLGGRQECWRSQINALLNAAEAVRRKTHAEPNVRS